MWGCHRGMIGPSRDPRAVLHEGGEARMGPWDPRPHWRRISPWTGWHVVRGLGRVVRAAGWGQVYNRQVGIASWRVADGVKSGGGGASSPQRLEALCGGGDGVPRVGSSEYVQLSGH